MYTLRLCLIYFTVLLWSDTFVFSCCWRGPENSLSHTTILKSPQCTSRQLGGKTVGPWTRHQSGSCRKSASLLASSRTPCCSDSHGANKCPGRKLTLQLCVCVCKKFVVCVRVSTDPRIEDGRLPGWHRSSSPACSAVSPVQPRARRGDLAPLPPVLVRPPASVGDRSPHRRESSTSPPRHDSVKGPCSTGGPGLWVCHASEDGYHRPELVTRLRGHQHGPLELHFTATPAGHLRRRYRLFPPVLGQERCVRWRCFPTKRCAAAAAAQRVSETSADSGNTFPELQDMFVGRDSNRGTH